MTGEFYPSVSFITSLNVRENFWRLLQFSMAWRRLKSLLQFYLSKHSLFSSRDLDGKISCGFYHIEPQLPWLVVHCFSVAKLCPTLCDPMDCSTGGFTVPQSLLKLMSTELVMPSNHLILCCYLLLLSSIFPGITVFSNELASHIRWLKYWSFSISPSSECSGLIFLTYASWQLPLEAREQGHFSSNSFLLFQVLFLSWSNSGSDLAWTLSSFLIDT